jgi:DNA-nicking Smr family endonuclease
MSSDEIDLHGLHVPEALARLAAVCNERLRAGNAGPIRVVHGYGSSGRGGDLRAAVREYLDRHAERVESVPGEKFFNNPGVTIVYPKRPLPSAGNPGFGGRRR